jgi:hypothetical protein
MSDTTERRVTPRRRDRAVEDDAWVSAFLERSPMGFLGTVVDGQPYVHPNLFVYDAAAHRIYLHTAARGGTRSALEVGSDVCFTVGEMGRLLPAVTALEFSVEYASVMVFGFGRIVDDAVEAEVGLQALLHKYFPRHEPGRDYAHIAASELRRTSVFRIDVVDWSAKAKLVGSDVDGFDYVLPAHWWRGGLTPKE